MKKIANKDIPDADTFYERLKKKSMQEIRKEIWNIQKDIVGIISKENRNKRIIILIDEQAFRCLENQMNMADTA